MQTGAKYRSVKGDGFRGSLDKQREGAANINWGKHEDDCKCIRCKQDKKKEDK